MSGDNDMVLWGTIRGWSKKLGIAEEVLRERCKDLPTQPCRVPNDPGATPLANAYAEPDVMEVCADLLKPPTVDTDGVTGKEIRNQIREEDEGP